MRDSGIPPSTEQATTWTAFLKTHAEVICATDFFTTEVWTAKGLVTHYTLFVIDIATRTVHIAGTTPNPNSDFSAQFKRTLKDAGIKVVHTAIEAPNMNAFAKHWVRSIKSECLSRILPFGARSLERAISHFTAHCNSERPHLGLVSERLGGLLKHYHHSAA